MADTMSETEVLSLLSLVSAAWPREALSADSIRRVWLPRLLRQERAIAATAIDMLIQSDNYAPSYARYYETYVSVAKRQPIAALPESSVTPPDVAVGNLRDIREAARRRTEAEGA